jgi:hypothetical protein
MVFFGKSEDHPGRNHDIQRKQKDDYRFISIDTTDWSPLPTGDQSSTHKYTFRWISPCRFIAILNSWNRNYQPLIGRFYAGVALVSAFIKTAPQLTGKGLAARGECDRARGRGALSSHPPRDREGGVDQAISSWNNALLSWTG